MAAFNVQCAMQAQTERIHVEIPLNVTGLCTHRCKYNQIYREEVTRVYLHA